MKKYLILCMMLISSMTINSQVEENPDPDCLSDYLGCLALSDEVLLEARLFLGEAEGSYSTKTLNKWYSAIIACGNEFLSC